VGKTRFLPQTPNPKPHRPWTLSPLGLSPNLQALDPKCQIRHDKRPVWFAGTAAGVDETIPIELQDEECKNRIRLEKISRLQNIATIGQSAAAHLLFQSIGQGRAGQGRAGQGRAGQGVGGRQGGREYECSCVVAGCRRCMGRGMYAPLSLPCPAPSLPPSLPPSPSLSSPSPAPSSSSAPSPSPSPSCSLARARAHSGDERALCGGMCTGFGGACCVATLTAFFADVLSH
jgi:hypothetical protein